MRFGRRIVTKPQKAKAKLDYHAWERGSNEHFNGLLRQYFPKGTDFTRLSPREVTYVVNQLNNRSRKRLDYQTPREVLKDKFPVAIEL